MAKIGVSLKIDVSKIDKALLFKGQKGTYLDAKVFIDIDQKDQFDNNGMITQELGKNAQQGDKGNILGNCRVFWNDSQQSAPQQGGYQQTAPQQGSGFQQQAPQQQSPARQATHQAMQQNAAQQGGSFDDDIPFAPIGLQYNNNLIHVI